MIEDSPARDESEEFLFDLVSALEAGALALDAIGRGEEVGREALDRAADAMHEVLTNPRVQGPPLTAADVDRMRELSALLTGGAPSPAARALAAKCRRWLTWPHA